MKTSDFNYNLPEELIAQTPLEQRDASRLLCMNRATGAISHHHFYDLPSILKPGDLIVLNDSRVIPARLHGNKIPSGGAIQFLLLTQRSHDTWEILTKPGRIATPGTQFSFGDGKLTGEILDILDDGVRLAKFTWQDGEDFFSILDEIGETPLPEYIEESLDDSERYQTVYNREPGSAAAPTAGLHFTPELLQKLADSGIDHVFLTLHVGLGTFRPVKVDDVADHKMHSESFYMPEDTAERIARAKREGGRIIAVGTTSCRTLESCADGKGGVKAGPDDTDIFIYPGHNFRAMDGLITNFHLPQSTLIMLVSAFAGYENTMSAYHTAVDERYRFYSFGDAMLIL